MYVTQKTSVPENITKDLIYTIPGYLYFLYILFPFRIWEPFVFTNQTEVIVVTVFFACLMLLFSLPKVYKAKIFHFTKIDLILAVYGIYLLFRLRYPLEKEYLFITFSIACIYLYFRNFPKKYLRGIIFLLPLAGVAQIIDGIMQFAMPWQNLSHIVGIFNNTGLFGGFVALGLVVCVGMVLFPGSNKWYFESIISIGLSIPLAIQVYASGSRASWIAALGTIFFLLYKTCHSALDTESSVTKNIQWKVILKKRWLRYFLALCLLVLSVFFSKHLYGLKKDSANGRVLIGMVSMGMINDVPAFGNGISGFRTEYMNHQADFFLKHPKSSCSVYADDVETPFNEFLKILVEQGIIGLLLFACLLYYLFEKENRGIASQARNDAQSIILFILIFGLFSYPFDKLPFVVLFVFSLATASKSQNAAFTVKMSKISYIRIPLLIALCLISPSIVRNVYFYSKSCLTWNQALVKFSYDKEKSLSQLEKLYPELENNPVFLTTYGKALGFGEHYHEATVVLEKAVKRLPLSTSYIELGKNYEADGLPLAALASWKHASYMVPSRFVPLYLTMKLHFKSGEYELARKCAEELLAKKIKIENPEIYRMKKEAMEILNYQLSIVNYQLPIVNSKKFPVIR